MMLSMMIFMMDLLKTLLVGGCFWVPLYVSSLEEFDVGMTYLPDYYNSQLFGISEELDDLLDSWSDCAGADETTDSSSTLTFGGCFMGSHAYGMLGLMPGCMNPCSDANSVLMCCEDSMLGTAMSLMPIIGHSVFAEALLKDCSLSTIPLMAALESTTQWQSAMTMALRISLNMTSGQSLLSFVGYFGWSFMLTSYDIWTRLAGFGLFVMTAAFVCFDFVMSTIQSYLMMVLESYYELDSE